MRSDPSGPKRLFIFSTALLLSLLLGSPAFPLSDPEIAAVQKSLRGKPAGERIAFWAERFAGIPYDEDPDGTYVTRAAVVADDKMDCMYHTFRSVELALSGNPGEAVRIALDKRFHSRGVLRDGRVANYEDRFRYGEEMIASGKWGKEITAALGKTRRIPGTRGRAHWDILPAKGFASRLNRLKSGDLVFFIKDPKKRTAGESVGHIGVSKVEAKSVYLIHASGTKKRGGAVRKVLLKEYLLKMPFIGVQVTRF
jgi:hypothetical protein